MHYLFSKMSERLIISKRQILIFIPYFLPDISYGGPIVSIVSMIKLLKNDYDVEVYTTKLRFDNQQELSNYDIKNLHLGYKVFRSNNHFNLFCKTFIKLIYSKNSFFYINSFFYLPNSLPFFVLSRLAILRNNKLIISQRGELEIQKINSKRRFLKNFFIKIFKLFGSSEIKFLSSSKSEIKFNNDYFPNNLQIQLPNIGRYSFFQKPKKKNVILKILFFNRVSPIKGIHFLLKEILEYKSNLPIEITIVGSCADINYLKKIKTYIKKIRKRKYIINYLGEVNPEKFNLNNFDVFILPTMGENFSHATVEASQAGLFCILSDKTPWFKKTDGAKKNLTSIALRNPRLFLDSIIKIIKMPNEKYFYYINEQQFEIKKELDKSKIKLLEFFKSLDNKEKI